MKFASIVVLTILTAGCGYNSSTMPMAAAPMVSVLTPDNAAAGGPAFTLTVTGTKFGGSSVVFFNGVAQPTTFQSGTQIQAMVPATAVTTSGTIQVFVRVTSDGRYGPTTQNSNAVDFTVN